MDPIRVEITPHGNHAYYMTVIFKIGYNQFKIIYKKII